MKSVSYYTLLIAVFLYLVNKAQTELMTEWIWNKGCHNQQPEDVTPAQIASGPGPCFHLCGNTTNYIALQGKSCRCLGELRLFLNSTEIGCLTCDGDQDLHCGHEAENLWSYYERGSEPADLSGHVDNSFDSICVAVKNQQGDLTLSVETCSERLPVICSGFLPECEGLHFDLWTWRDAGKVCGENRGSQVDSDDLLNKCNRNTQDLDNNYYYWIGLRRISYNAYLTTESSSLSLSPTPTLSSSSLPTSIWLESTSSIPLTSSSSLISTSSTPLSTSIFSPTTSSLSASASSLPLVSKSSLILLSSSSSLTYSSSSSLSLSALSSLSSSSSLSTITLLQPSTPFTVEPTPSLQATSPPSSSLSSPLISPTIKLFASVSTTSIIQTSSSYPSLSNSSSVATTEISPKASPTAENIQPNKSVQTTTLSKAMSPAANRTPAINIPTTPLRLPPTEGPGITNTALNKTQPSHDIMATTTNAFGTSTHSNTTTTTTTPEAAIITSLKRSQTSGLTTTRLVFTTTQRSTKQSTTPIRRETTTHTLDNPLAMHQMMTADKELKTYYAAFGASTIALLVLIAMFLYLINRSIRKLSYRYLYNKEKYRKQHYGVEERQGNGLRDGATYTENIRRTRRPVMSVDNVRYTTGVNNNGYTWDTRSYGDGYHDDDDIDVNAIYKEEHPIGFRSATRFNGRHDPSALHTGYTSSGRLPSDHL